MASSHSNDGWAPPWAYDKKPYAALVARSNDDGAVMSWAPPGPAAVRVAVADFLETRLGELSESELLSDTTFLYVVVRRTAQPGEATGEVGDDTPIAEFGYGAPPASPDEWPVVELGALLKESVEKLRLQRSA